MRRLVALFVIASAFAGIVAAAPASDSGPTAKAAAKTPKLTKKQKKASKKCKKKSFRHRYELVKIVKKNGKRVGVYRCHKLSDAELNAEQDAATQGIEEDDPDGEGGQPPIKL